MEHYLLDDRARHCSPPAMRRSATCSRSSSSRRRSTNSSTSWTTGPIGCRSRLRVSPDCLDETSVSSVVEVRPRRRRPARAPSSRTRDARGAPGARTVRSPFGCSDRLGGEDLGQTRQGQVGGAQADPFGGHLRGLGARSDAAAALHASRSTTATAADVHDRSTPTPSSRRSANSIVYLMGEGRHEETLQQTGRPSAHPPERWHHRHGVRRLGAGRTRGLGGRRLQLLGRPAASRCARLGSGGIWELFLPDVGPRASATSTRSCRPTASCCSKPTRTRRRPRCRRRPRRSCSNAAHPRVV